MDRGTDEWMSTGSGHTRKGKCALFILALRFNIRFRWCSSMSLSLSSFLCPLPSFSLSHDVSLCISALHHDHRLLSKRKEREGAMDNIGNDLLFLLCSLSFSFLFAHPFPCPLNSVCPLKIVQHVNNKKSRGSLKRHAANTHLRMWFSFFIVYRTTTRVISQAQEDTGIDILGPSSRHCKEATSSAMLLISKEK